MKFLKIHKLKVRILFWSAFALMMVFVALPVFFFFYLFDEAKVRQMAIDQFDQKNYNVSINGMIRPKLWHGLSLEISGLELRDMESKPLAKVRTISCQLSWLDLVVGHYRVRRIALNGVDLNEKNMLNYGFDNILNGSHLNQAEFERINIIYVSGINTVGESVAYPISDGSVRIKLGANFADFHMGFKLESKGLYILTDGKLRLISDNLIKFDEFKTSVLNQTDKFVLQAEASIQLKEKKLLLHNMSGDFAVLNYSGTVLAENVGFGMSGISAESMQLNIDLSNKLISQHAVLNVNHALFSNYSSAILDKVRLDYTADIDKHHLAINSEIGHLNVDKSSHITSDSCINKVDFLSPSLRSSGLHAVLSGVCEYDVASNLFNLNLAGDLANAPLKLDLQVYNNGKKPYVVVSGDVGDLDLSRVDVSSGKLLPLYYDDGPLPFAWLSLLNMDANLRIRHFALDRITLDNVSSQFSVSSNELKINKITADAYSGILSGLAKVTKTDDGYNIVAKQNIKNLELEKVFAGLFDVTAISGIAHLNLDVFANGVYSYNDVHKQLNGQININATHGAFRGVDFNLFVNPNGINLSSAKATMFDQLAAKFYFNRGISDNGTLSFSSKYVIANGGGTVDFVDNKLNYMLDIKSALPRNDQKISGVLIPVTIAGGLFEPQVNIQNIHLYTKGGVLESGAKARSSVKRSAKSKKK